MKKAQSDLVRMSMDLSRLLRRTVERGVGSVNILRLHALGIIGEGNTLTMSEFARAMNVSPSTATEFADRLLACGYIRRAPDAQNRRAVLISLTPLGARLVRSGMRRKERLLSRMFARLSPRDRLHLQRIFRLLLQKDPA